MSEFSGSTWLHSWPIPDSIILIARWDGICPEGSDVGPGGGKEWQDGGVLGLILILILYYSRVNMVMDILGIKI